VLNVSLLVKTDAEWHRSLLMGVARYAEDVNGWNFNIPKASHAGDVLPDPNGSADGVICRVTSPEVEAAVLALHVPAVNVSWQQYASQDQIPSVCSDEESCARMIAQFLLEKQYDQIGFVGFPPWQNYSSKFNDTLEQFFAQRRIAYSSFPLSEDRTHIEGIDRRQLVSWLAKLRKPAGIVVWNTVVGQIVTRVCADHSIPIPEKVGVISIEHDPLWSALAPIPVSYVDQDPWRVGYLAAKLLHSLIKGHPVPEHPIKIGPISIVQRRSTEASVAKDPVLDRALKYIHENARCGITVKNVVDHASVSRRGLESRFKNELDCSPAALIKRVQLQHVAKLLRTTKLNISAIAQQSGFAYPEVLMRAFKRAYGVTPMQFRGAGELDGRRQPVNVR